MATPDARSAEEPQTVMNVQAFLSAAASKRRAGSDSKQVDGNASVEAAAGDENSANAKQPTAPTSARAAMTQAERKERRRRFREFLARQNQANVRRERHVEQLEQMLMVRRAIAEFFLVCIYIEDRPLINFRGRANPLVLYGLFFRQL